MLPLSTDYQSKSGWKMRERNMIAGRSKESEQTENDISYSFIMADTKPVCKGVHCWRINIKHQNANQSGWITFGVSPQMHYYGDWNGGKRYDDEVWGISCTD